MLRPAFATIALLACALCLLGCSNRDPAVSISNVGEPERISIGKFGDQGPVRKLRLQVEGQLNGTAQLTVLMEGQPYHVFNVSDRVDVSWTDDWPHDRARLAYTPGTVTSGTLRVRYRFVD